MKEKLEEQDFIEKVEVGLKEIEEGKTLPREEVKKIIESWRRQNSI